MTDGESEIPPEVAEALATLRAAYARALPEKLATLASAFERADRDRTVESLEQLYREVHRLYGSAGAYRLADLAAPLGRLELALFAVTDEGRVADDEWWRAVRDDHAEAQARGRAHAG